MPDLKLIWKIKCDSLSYDNRTVGKMGKEFFGCRFGDRTRVGGGSGENSEMGANFVILVTSFS